MSDDNQDNGNNPLRRRGVSISLNPEAKQEIELLETDRITNRRNEVLRFKMQGLTLQDIADKLEVSIATVSRDLDFIRKQNQETYTTSFNRDEVVAESIHAYQQIIDQAWIEWRNPMTPPAQKAKYLDLIRVTYNDKLRVMQEVGLIEVARETVDHNININAIADWTDEVRKAAAQAILESMLTPNLLPPIPDDYIDPTFIDVTPYDPKEDKELNDNKDLEKKKETF